MTTLASRAAAQSDDTTADLVRGLYCDMALGRRFDQEAYALQRQGELGLWLMSLGQEAAQAGSIHAMRPADHVFPSYREHVSATVTSPTRTRELRSMLSTSGNCAWTVNDSEPWPCVPGNGREFAPCQPHADELARTTARMTAILLRRVMIRPRAASSFLEARVPGRSAAPLPAKYVAEHNPDATNPRCR